MISLSRIRLVAFIAGAATMAVQMIAARVMAPAVGQAAPVWAVVIAASLVSMSVGYWLGGRISDRRPSAATIGSALTVAAVVLVGVAFVGPTVMGWAGSIIDSPTAASVAGATIGYLALFALPAVLLAMTPPFMVRLAFTDNVRGGRTVGGLVAISTVGSLLGTLATALVVIPWIGTHATMLVTAALIGIAVVVLRIGDTSAAATVESRGNEAVRGSEDAREGHTFGAVTAIRHSMLVVVVAAAGAATMFVEIGTARLIAPFYGSSQVVWANLIALVLLFLALGSYVGGRIADRFPHPIGFARVLLAGGVATLVLPFIAGPIMRLSTGGIDSAAIGTVVGSFVATLAVIALPILLLGIITPYAVRLDFDGAESAGSRAGALYAASSSGSIVGTLLAALVIIPGIGTPQTLVIGGGALLALAAVIAPPRWRARVAAVSVVLVAGALFIAGGPIKPLDDGKVVFEGESRYQFVQVVEYESGRRVLQLNEGWAVHSVYDPSADFTGGIWDHFSLLPALVDPSVRGEDDSLLIIGNAAGTAAVQYRKLWPDVEIDGVELDPLVSEVGREYFAMSGDNLTVHGGDGRPFLARADQSWQMIHVDAYRQPYIPFYLTTREFFVEAREHLADGGVLSINVGTAPGDDRIVEAISATMRDVFPTVVRYRAEEYNEIILATNDPDVDVDDLRDRARESVISDQVDRESRLGQIAAQFIAESEAVARDDDKVMTDDHAPVEWLTDRMIAIEARGSGS